MSERIETEAHVRRLDLEAAVVTRYGSVSERRKTLLGLYEQMTAAYLRAEEDVRQKGLREVYVNGRQRTTRKNICFEQMIKAASALTRLVNAILPDTRKAEDPPEDEAGDEDLDLDDY